MAALRAALRGMIAFQCVLLAPAVVWAGPITGLVLGPGYAKAAGVLTALAPYIFFSGLAPILTISVNYVGEARRRVPIALATVVLTVGASALLIPSPRGDRRSRRHGHRLRVLHVGASVALPAPAQPAPGPAGVVARVCFDGGGGDGHRACRDRHEGSVPPRLAPRRVRRRGDVRGDAPVHARASRPGSRPRLPVSCVASCADCCVAAAQAIAARRREPATPPTLTVAAARLSPADAPSPRCRSRPIPLWLRLRNPGETARAVGALPCIRPSERSKGHVGLGRPHRQARGHRDRPNRRTPPSTPAAEPPKWLQGAEPPVRRPEPQPPSTPAAEPPKWLQGAEPPVRRPEPQPPSTPAAEPPKWLQGAEPPVRRPEPQPPSTPAAEPPRWLQGAEPPVRRPEPEPPSTPAAEPPKWLQGAEPPVRRPEPQPPSTPAAEPPAWARKAAAATPADAPVGPGPPAADRPTSSRPSSPPAHPPRRNRRRTKEARSGRFGDSVARFRTTDLRDLVAGRRGDRGVRVAFRRSSAMATVSTLTISISRGSRWSRPPSPGAGRCIQHRSRRHDRRIRSSSNGCWPKAGSAWGWAKPGSRTGCAPRYPPGATRTPRTRPRGAARVVRSNAVRRSTAGGTAPARAASRCWEGTRRRRRRTRLG